MRKNNMFGIVIKEEWKLDRKKFLIILGIVFAVNLASIVMLATGYLRIRVTGVPNPNARQTASSAIMPFVFVMELFTILICPGILVDKHIKELFKDDSCFLYKMLPANGFEIFGGKAVVALIEFISFGIVTFVTALVGATELLMIAQKTSSGLSQNFGHTLKLIIEAMLSDEGINLLALAVPLIAAICFAFSLAMFIAILRKSFSINLDSKIITVLGIIICAALIIKIVDIKYNSIIFAVLTVATFIANCVLYDRRVSV